MDLTVTCYTGNAHKTRFILWMGLIYNSKIIEKCDHPTNSFLWEKIYPFSHINSGTKIHIKSPKMMHYPLLIWRGFYLNRPTKVILYVEIYHLRKIESNLE